MIKVDDKMLNEFLDIMAEYNEFVFGDYEDIKRQLEICLNSQGYWSACAIKVYYNKDTKEFSVENRF